MTRDELIARLRDHVHVGDGAMGTHIYTKGIPFERCYEELNLSNPHLVRIVHREYLEAGAEIIETNTFQANAIRMKRFELQDQVHAINKAAAELARKEAGDKAMVAGSIGPIGSQSAKEEDPPDLEKREAFREQILALQEGGVDFILFETFVDLEELVLAMEVLGAETDLPGIGSLTFTEKGNTMCGVNAAQAVQRLEAAGAAGIGANCGTGPNGVLKVIEELGRLTDLPIIGYPNAGFPEYRNGRYHYLATPEYIGDMAKRMAQAGANLVGGCCGTNPETVDAIAKRLRGVKPFPRKRISPDTIARRKRSEPTIAIHEPVAHLFLDKIPTETSVVVELDPPKGLGINRILEASEQLRDAGADAITVGDSPLAVTRMDAVAMSNLIQTRVGIECIAHVACRDRNVIGTQSHLLGAWALGVKSILGITGDPAKIGPQSGATSVYDLNSFKLVDMLQHFNDGRTPAGNKLGVATDFKIGVAYNPNVKNQEVQVRRLEKKIAAGAHFVQTQPVFSAEKVEETWEATRHLDIPIFIGIFPLINHRNAEFLHFEVPGIDIPDHIRARMEGTTKEDGPARGLEIAKEVITAAMERFPGIYLIPPFSKAGPALGLMEHIQEEKVRMGQVPAAAVSGNQG